MGEKSHVYLSIVHAITEDSPLGKRSKPIVMANLGNELEVSKKHARQLMRSLEKYIAKRWGDGTPTAEEVKQTAHELKPMERQFRMLSSREFGMRLLTEVAWRELGISKALSGFAKAWRIEFDFERVVFAMVYNRLVDPKSKHACNLWAKERAYLPEAKAWGVQHFYRALDVLTTSGKGSKSGSRRFFGTNCRMKSARCG